MDSFKFGDSIFRPMNRNDKFMFNLGVIVIFIALVGALIGGTNEEERSAEKGGEINWEELLKFSDRKGGDLNEGEEETLTYDTGAYVVSAVFVLKWRDEPDTSIQVGGESVGLHNDPDTFKLTVRDPDGTVYEEEGENEYDPNGGEGVLTINVTAENGGDYYGPWEVTVRLVNAGDQKPMGQGVGLQQDNSNSYTLEVNMYYRLD
jgi:hypothetical protein